MNKASLHRSLSQPRSLGWFRWLGRAALLALLLAWPVLGKIVDNFTDPNKGGWTDFTFGPNLGKTTETNGQFIIDVPGVNQPLFAASTKTSLSFVLQPNRTLEFRVDLVSANDPNAVAVLGWFPSANNVSSLTGYGLAVSSDRIVVSKGLNKYFYDGPQPTNSQNVTLVLSLTEQTNGTVLIETKVLDKGNNNAVMFDQIFTDTAGADVLARGTDDPAAPWTGSGHVSLLNYADEPKSGALPVYEVVFANLQAFVLDNSVLDDFSGATKVGWTDFTFGPNLGKATQTNGQFVIDIPGVNQPLFAASTKSSANFTVDDGDRIEGRVTMVSGNDANAVGVIGWFPSANQVSSLAGYGLAVSSDRIVVTKGLNEYFYDGAPPSKSSSITLDLSLTGVGTSVLIETKILDNDNNGAVLFDQTFLDTTNADVLARGTDSSPAPWTGVGHFALLNYADEPKSGALPVYEVIFANLQVSAPPAATNQPAIIGNLQPLPYTNYVPASATVSFAVTDDQPLVDSQISVSLNGQTYYNTNGLTLTGSGANRNVSLGGLQANVNYTGQAQVVDADGAVTTSPIIFDTFIASDLVIEAEDYNYNGGSFIDNPVPISEGGVQANSYMSQVAVPDTDYADNHTDFRNLYRPGDHVRVQHSLDVVRQKFVAAGGADAQVYDYDLVDIVAGNWLDYTRTFAAGTYQVYLREGLFNGTQAEADLQLVTSDPTQPNQATQSLGAFLAQKSGFQLANVPLTDGLGQNKILVRLSGVQTLRLVQKSSDPSNGGLFQNYLIFVPVSDTNVQRASIASVAPAANSTTQTVTPAISVSIQNRDTLVQTNSIVLILNGVTVPAQITATTNGANVTYTPPTLPASGATNTARISFSDNQKVFIMQQWTFVITYLSLDPANRQFGSGQTRGFNVRVVQAPAGSSLQNSLTRAEAQLAANSTIPKWVDTNTVADVVNFDQNAGATGDFGPRQMVPGLDPANGTDDYAMEVEGYLDLPAGIQRFGVISDDGYKVVAGAKITDTDPALAFHNGGPANETFDFVAPQAGLYPFRMVWYNRGGASYAEWFSVDLTSGNRTLINDPNTAGAIKAYRTLATPALHLQAVAQLGGTFADDTTAIINTTAQTATFARPTGTKFFRLRSDNPVSVKILSISVSSTNVVLTYGPPR